jgi:cytochrome P450
MAITIELFENAPLSPASPEDLYFSKQQQAWIVARYREVLIALRSTDLSQTGPPTAIANRGVRPDREKMRDELLTALPSFHRAEWQMQINGLASAQLRLLATSRPIDLFADFFRPWCLASAVALTGVDLTYNEYLATLVSYLCDADAAPHDVNLKARAKEADQELGRMFRQWNASSYKSMFLGIVQTLPTFLASAWAALLQHPSQLRQLQKYPGRMPKATEELLRYAGPVHTLFRRANKDINIFGTKIQGGEDLILRLGSANRDPLQFLEPDRLDLTREIAGHLALSSGGHYCIGARLVRMMIATATQAILTQYSEPRLSSPVKWSCGTMLIWPSSLPVILGEPL